MQAHNSGKVSGRAKVGASISRHHNHTLAERDKHGPGGAYCLTRITQTIGGIKVIPSAKISTSLPMLKELVDAYRAGSPGQSGRTSSFRRTGDLGGSGQSRSPQGIVVLAVALGCCRSEMAGRSIL